VFVFSKNSLIRIINQPITGIPPFVWAPPNRQDQLKCPDSGRFDTGQSTRTVQGTRRPELDALLKVQRIFNYTVYCTSKFYGL